MAPTTQSMPTNSPSSDGSSGRRRRVLVLTAIVAAGVLSFVGVRATTRPEPADLIVTQDVPADVAAELDTTWGRFAERFAGQRTCLDDVSIRLVREVEGGDARYVAERALIEIRIPTTPARFRESFVHELAHHVERTCGRFAELQNRLRPLLGGADKPWATGETWFDIPSERFAEHVVELVNRERIRHVAEISIDEEVLALVSSWGRDDELP